MLKSRPITLEALFDYLAYEVLGGLPKNIQNFLITAAVLNQIEPEIMNILLDISDSESILRNVHEGGLFLSTVGDHIYQFQNLFHNFLKDQLWQNKEKAQALHQICANYFYNQQRFEAAIYHLIEANDYERAGELIVRIGPDLIRMGRLDGLTSGFSGFLK